MSKYYNSKFYSKPIEVINDDWNIMVITTDNLGREAIYSWYNILEKYSESFYINKCLLWGYMQNNIKKVLVIWAWWGAFIKHLEDHVKDILITWIDIDETMLEIAKNELLIETKDIIIWDVVNCLDQLIKSWSSYDLILFDVYWWTWEIPKNLISENIFNKIKLLLNKTWIFSINYSNFNIWSNNKYDISRVEYYQEIHKNIKNTFWKEFILFLLWEGDWWNISGIYNLDKKYSRDEILSNYFKKVNNNEIIFDPMTIKWIYIDEKWEFLR